MNHSVVMTVQVLEDLAAIHAWIARDASTAAADRWIEGVFLRVRSLETMPRRFPAAREATALPGTDLRQLVCGRIRVLFSVAEGEVRVLHARHCSRRDASRCDLGDWRWPDAARERRVRYVGWRPRGRQRRRVSAG